MYRVFVIVLVLLLVGCGTSQEVKDSTHDQRIAVGAYMSNFMDKGKTTQAQDQDVIRQCYRTLVLLDWGLNDDEEAKELYNN